MRALCGRLGFGIVALLFGSALAQADEVRKVQVQKGDTLSGISEREVGRPVYGASGSLRKVLKLNPKVKNPNYIRVGQWLFVPGAPTTPALAEVAPAPQAPVPMKESAREDLLAIPLQPPAPPVAEAQVAPAQTTPAPVEPAEELTVQIQGPAAAEASAPVAPAPVAQVPPPAPTDALAVPAEAPRNIERVIEQKVAVTPETPVSRTAEPKSLTGSEPKATTVTPPPSSVPRESVSPTTPPVSFDTRPSQIETLRARLWLQARLDQVRRGEVVNRGIASSNVMDFRRFYAEQITGRVLPATDIPRWSVHATRE
jgi:LysM repeat protein